MIAVVKEKYPFVPVGILFKHPFKSIDYAGSITSPALALISKNDQIIPKHHAYNLTKVWKGKVTSKEFDEDHNSIMDNKEFWKLIEGFVSENTCSIK